MIQTSNTDQTSSVTDGDDNKNIVYKKPSNKKLQRLASYEDGDINKAQSKLIKSI
mgnify:CR=1 FL=1